jgi:phosphonatase-like hydrolase
MSSAVALACLDMAGTTVADDGLVEGAFGDALAALGVHADDARRAAMFDHVRRTMGTSKIEVFRSLFPDERDAQRANTSFEEAYGRRVDEGGAAPLPGAEDAIDALREAGVRVALTTGFAPNTRDQLLHALGWVDRVDLVVSPADAGRGRPFPDMILHAMGVLEVADPRQVAVAGDTAADMEAGRRAGAVIVAGVLTGTGDRAALTTSGATHVLDSVADLPALLGIAASG